LIQSGFFIQKHKFRITTDFPVAFNNTNRLLPRGKVNGNARCTSFVTACERLFLGKTLDYIDLGGVGGGLILGFFATWTVGIEDSDVLIRSERAKTKTKSRPEIPLYGPEAAFVILPSKVAGISSRAAEADCILKKQ
jgi:hypothetical protein